MQERKPGNGKPEVRVVVSDFHLGEGRRNWDGTLNILEDFSADARFVEFLDYLNQAYESVELVLAGNFFEMLRCRMGQDFPDIMYETYALELVRVQMEGHSEVMDALKRFLSKDANRLVYLVGEADLGVLWPRVQDELKARISKKIEFVGSKYFKDGIWIEHGDQYESMYNFDWKDPFRLVEDLPILKLPWGAFFFAHFVQPLRRIRPQFYRVRPMKAYLTWTFLFETRFLLKIIAQFGRLLWRSFSRKQYPGSAWWDVMKVFHRSVDSDSLERRAEAILQDDSVNKVIFGYTHLSNYRQFRNGKEYFNAGTWTSHLSLEMRHLGNTQKLNFVLIELRDEPRAKLMEWQGKYEPVADFT
ncbi:MAG: hypothetical protein EA369_00215 [Bradymonadales bacterium]|nr:MAG: hypothetical protein EA369_00215 [Bradymonadales bacterium]